MKRSLLTKFALFFALLISFSFTAHDDHKSYADGTLTAAERKYAVDYYIQTRDRLVSDLKGLSPEQLNWKADTSRWSVAQCTEHIALAESLIWQWVQMTLKQPATPEKRSEVKMTTEQLVTAVTDRSHKAKAPEMLVPSGRFPTTQAALAAFVSRRDSTILYIQSTQDDLKDHFIVHPAFGPLDLYQALVLLSGHCARHTLQLEEVKANPNFPKH